MQPKGVKAAVHTSCPPPHLQQRKNLNSDQAKTFTALARKPENPGQICTQRALGGDRALPGVPAHVQLVIQHLFSDLGFFVQGVGFRGFAPHTRTKAGGFRAFRALRRNTSCRNHKGTETRNPVSLPRTLGPECYRAYRSCNLASASTLERVC